MKLKNKNGFTLIELLSIISILAIILLIAVPVINNVIETSKRKAFTNDATLVLKHSRLLYDVSLIKSMTFDEFIIDFDTGENVKLLNLKSQKKPSGNVIIKSTGEIIMAIHDNEYCAIVEDNSIVVTKYNKDEGCGPRPNYAFITKWSTTEDNQLIQMPFSESYEYDIKIDWGDGVVEKYTTHDVSHTYANAGEYIIKISGIMPYFVSNANNTMIEIIDFGEVNVEKLQFGGSSNSYCESLRGTIPKPREYSFKNVKSFEYLFQRCTNLTGTIPEDLFKSAINAEDFTLVFSDATGLSGSIPENLFKYNTNATIFFWTFRNVHGLTGPIPENLFKHNINVISFRGTFYASKGLSGEIPKNLFKYNTQVNTFENTFAYVTGLSGEIPEDIFKYNTSATIFRSTFLGTTGLSGEIPEDIFKYNVNVKDFYQVFRGVKNLTGNAPKLWETHPNVISDRAFNGLINLSNYEEIPSNWK